MSTKKVVNFPHSRDIDLQMLQVQAEEQNVRRFYYHSGEYESLFIKAELLKADKNGPWVTTVRSTQPPLLLCYRSNNH